uniref:Importin-5-like isoform X1 n=2 Tax=Nicotiana tabacum TaxID=4097 RepID=A0A1S3Z2C7_TOBAC|nr:PREDICTED: importin-5-like isoform X1 [Nicotiana tabacum]
MDTEPTQFQISQMEAILGPDSEPFETFISDHMSSSEENDSEAKLSMFNMIKHKDPESLAIKLCNFLSSSQNIDSREKCVVLLSKLLTADDNDLCNTWRNLSVSTQSTIKCTLLNRISQLEESKSIIVELRGTVMDLAASLIPDNNWPELLPFLYQCLTSTSSNKLKESAFLIFAYLADDIGEIMVPNYVKMLHPLFLNTLNDDTLNDLDVRIAAMNAVISFIQCIPSSNEKERFQDLLPGMMKTLTDGLCNGDQEDAAKDVLDLFIELAENEPKFLRRQLVVVVGSIMEIAEAKSLEEETRHLAIEFMLTLVEARDKVPGMMKRVPRFTDTCFAILLNLLLDIKDEPSWHSANTEHENAGERDSYGFGKECLGRFSKALGGKTVAPIAIEQLSAYLVAPEWEKRHAALIALASIAKGTSKVMIKYLEQIVNMVLRSFQDPHPRVRWAAINAIYQLSTDFCPDLQEQYHNQVLPALAAAMDDSQIPRLSEKPETLIPYLDGILNRVFVLLQKDNQMVQQAALNALSATADLSKEHFQKYYDSVMQYLRTILVDANDKSNHMLQSQALECISIVGMAVGKEKFRNDFKQVMEVLKSLQESQAKEFDTIVRSVQAYGRICQCMGKDFLPYMSTIIPPLVECAQLEPDKTVSSDKLDDSIHKVKFGNEIICVKGSDLLAGKSVACKILALYAQKLEEDFYPWISQAASIFVPLLKFDFNNDVREGASAALYFLLHSAKLAVDKGTAQGGNQAYLKQLSGDIILAIGDTLYSEHETEVCATKLSGLKECLEICGPLLNEDQVHSIIDEIKHVIIESSHRKGELTERAKAEDFDAEEAELLREEREQEEEIFSGVAEILVTLIKSFKASFMPFLDELSPYLMPTTGKDKTAKERSICIYIYDQLMEHCGEAALKYYNMYLPFLLDACNDDSSDVRQNALYGLGLSAEYGGYAFRPFIGEALSRINVVITHLNALEPENAEAYDNAVSALGKICQFHRETIDSAQIIAWLNCLPIKDDKDEAKVVHDQLCSMVERSDRELWDPNYLHLPKVISVFAEVLCAGEDLVTEETAKRMINLLRHFRKTVPAATWESACSLLLPQQEMELESILSPEEDVNISTHTMKLLVL